MPRLLLRALAAALALGSISFAAPSVAQAACGSSGYAYAGLGSSQRAYGVAAWVQAVAAPEVLSGHVAGWVGVGGPGAGPNGSDEWLQVGFSAFPGTSTSSLYYEVAQPHQAPQYHEVALGVPAGSIHKVAVVELASRRSWWRVFVDDRAVGEPVYLPGSHGAWRPMATTETWGAGSFVCNRFSYRFGSVSVATRPGGGWERLTSHYTFQDHGYRIRKLGAATFLAGAL
ncbi:MAG: hypothetical protein V7645_2898 [Actinomycetota bacterium]